MCTVIAHEIKCLVIQASVMLLTASPDHTYVSLSLLLHTQAQNTTRSRVVIPASVLLVSQATGR